MNNISLQTFTNQRPSIPEQPKRPERPPLTDEGKDQARQGAVSAIESKQQQQLAKTFIETSSQLAGNENLETLQELARLAKSNQVVQVINDNDGEKLKSIAAQRQEKIENIFQGIQDNDLQRVGNQLDRRA